MSRKAPNHVLQALAFLAAAYPHFKLNQATIQAYSLLLADVPAGALHGAALKLAAGDSPYFPTAGMLRAAAFDLLHADEQIPTAQEAWADVKRCVRLYGVNNQPQFSHDLTRQAIEGIGGWRTFCLADMDKDMSDRARFMQAYEVLLQRTREDQRMLPALRDTKQLAAANKVSDALATLGQSLIVNSAED